MNIMPASSPWSFAGRCLKLTWSGCTATVAGGKRGNNRKRPSGDSIPMVFLSMNPDGCAKVLWAFLQDLCAAAGYTIDEILITIMVEVPHNSYGGRGIRAVGIIRKVSCVFNHRSRRCAPNYHSPELDRLGLIGFEVA